MWEQKVKDSRIALKNKKHIIIGEDHGLRITTNNNQQLKPSVVLAVHTLGKEKNAAAIIQKSIAAQAGSHNMIMAEPNLINNSVLAKKPADLGQKQTETQMSRGAASSVLTVADTLKAIAKDKSDGLKMIPTNIKDAYNRSKSGENAHPNEFNRLNNAVGSSIKGDEVVLAIRKAGKENVSDLAKNLKTEYTNFINPNHTDKAQKILSLIPNLEQHANSKTSLITADDYVVRLPNIADNMMNRFYNVISSIRSVEETIAHEEAPDNLASMKPIMIVGDAHAQHIATYNELKTNKHVVRLGDYNDFMKDKAPFDYVKS